MDFTGFYATFRPLGPTWPGGSPTPADERQRSRFLAPWPNTLALLRREVTLLRPVEVIAQVDLPATKIRVDGLPRADARPASPGVVLSLELLGEGWAHFPCDTFADWQSNFRAIGLTLEALRAIDRYGVSRSREQYRGWMQLSAATGPTAEEAATLISTYTGDLPSALLRSAEAAVSAGKRALRKAHPDHGGSMAALDSVERARRALQAYHASGEGGGS